MQLLTKLFLTFFKIGLLGFGGGLAIVALIYSSIQSVMTITATEFADIVAIAQVTPGPIAVNTATYVGYHVGGILGAFMATFGVAVPAYILTSTACKIMTSFNTNPLVKGALSGIRPATVGLIATAFITLAKPALFADNHLAAGLITALSSLPIDVVSIIMCVVSVILIGKYKKSAFKVLIMMGIIGAIIGVA